MAKAKSPVKKQNRIDLENLSQRDRDFLTLEVKDSMKKYKIEKQGVYDRRFALNKKLREAGITAEEILNGEAALEKSKAKKEQQPAPPKKGKAKREAQSAPSINHSRELMVVPEKVVPVIMKPIEINFENFSIKLNGVPKKISVNPDTNAIEIDL